MKEFIQETGKSGYASEKKVKFKQLTEIMTKVEKLIGDISHLWFEKICGSINSDLADINIRQGC